MNTWPQGKKDKFRNGFQSAHEGDLYGTLENNVQAFQINVHFKFSTVSLLKYYGSKYV